MTQIIFLNGPSSSGKSSIARSLQSKSEKPYLHIGIDTVIWMMPDHLSDWKGDDGFREGFYWRDDMSMHGGKEIQMGPFAVRVAGVFRKLVVLLASSGFNVIIDEIALGRSELDGWREELKAFDVTWVGITAPLSTLEDRERLRPDRVHGSARSQVARVHVGVNYDLMLDSSTEDAGRISDRILAFAYDKRKPEVGAIIEDRYTIPVDSVVSRSHFVLITGCSGGGKSSLIGELHKRGFDIVSEPGREVVKEQLSIDGDGLPWVNPQKFADLILSRYIHTFNTRANGSRWTFFDRGIPDIIGHFSYLAKAAPQYVKNAARKFRYAGTVFVTPPWPEIFRNDDERRHSFEESEQAYKHLITTYEGYGYQVIVLPKSSVEARADFVLAQLDSIAAATMDEQK